jgi:hypothetical protein
MFKADPPFMEARGSNQKKMLQAQQPLSSASNLPIDVTVDKFQEEQCQRCSFGSRCRKFIAGHSRADENISLKTDRASLVKWDG